MVNVLTYKDFIVDFFNKHLQVNTVLVGDRKSLTKQRSIVYPLANVEYLDKVIRDSEDVYRFEIIIASLSNEDIELSVINDCNMIGDDMVTYFEDTDRFEDLEIFTNITMKPFSDSFGDRVAGITFVVSMTGFREACKLSIPTINERL